MKSVLQKAINFIRIIIPDETRICDELHDTKEGMEWCAKHCQDGYVRDQCFIHFLKTMDL
jgi:hypothetical protein